MQAGSDSIAPTRWPPRRRFLHATVGLVSHITGQAVRGTIEGFAFIFGREELRKEQRAVRRAASLYWRAQVLDRNGRTEEAFRTGEQAFLALREADPRETYIQLGGLVASFLDDLAEELGNPAAARPALQELLGVLKSLQSESGTRSAALDQVVEWIESRVTST